MFFFLFQFLKQSDLVCYKHRITQKLFYVKLKRRYCVHSISVHKAHSFDKRPLIKRSIIILGFYYMISHENEFNYEKFIRKICAYFVFMHVALTTEVLCYFLFLLIGVFPYVKSEYSLNSVHMIHIFFKCPLIKRPRMILEFYYMTISAFNVLNSLGFYNMISDKN